MTQNLGVGAKFLKIHCVTVFPIITSEFLLEEEKSDYREKNKKITLKIGPVKKTTCLPLEEEKSDYQEKT